MTLHREMAGLRLPADLEVRRTRGGHWLDCVEFVVNDEVVAVTGQVWGSRSRSATEIAHNYAMGRIDQATTRAKVKVWEVYTMTGGRPRRAGPDQTDLRQAALFLSRQRHVRHAVHQHRQNSASSTTA